MKLSEYRRRLAKLARECKGMDPDVLCGRFSDFEDVDNDHPKVIDAGKLHTSDQWKTTFHTTMSAEDKAKMRPCVIVAQGN